MTDPNPQTTSNEPNTCESCGDDIPTDERLCEDCAEIADYDTVTQGGD